MADVAKFAELLKALISPTNAERQQAETLYQQAKAGEADQLLIGFCAVLAQPGLEEAVRRQAAVLLRQLVTLGSEKDFVFARVTAPNKQAIAAELLSRFKGEEDSKLQKKIGEVVAKLAECVSDDDEKGWLAPGQKGWPTLLPEMLQMADCSQNPNPNSCEAALRLVKDLIQPMREAVVNAQQVLGGLIQNGLGGENLKIKCASLLLICEMVGVLDKKDWAPLIATGPILNSVLLQLAQANQQDDVQECLQAFVEVASIEPDFFKKQLSDSLEPAKILSTLVKTREGVEEGIRNLALEWLVTYSEKKPKWIAKSAPNFAPLALECCMDLMLEVEQGDEALNEWATRMDDEEGEEDSDELFHSGEEAIDRVVEAVGMETLSSALFQLVGNFTSQDAWQAKLAGLAAIKQTVEYVEEASHIDEMAKLLLAHVDHAHPRVRYTSLHAIGQLANDQAPQFQDKWHQTVMPVLLTKMDDQVDRVASMAMSAFVSFGEELDNTLMLQYANAFMEKLVSRLKSTNHRMVKEESITSIAVIAGVIEKDFSTYYDAIMPLLKQLVMTATGEKENRLRGKAFECMSLLGIAVGKEKFLPDAQEAVGEMLKTPMEADDLQREYIKEASERICKCLKNDFAMFLPHLLPKLFSSLKMESEDVAPNAGKDDDDEQFITVSTGEGKLVKVRTSKFEELLQSVQLIHTFCSEMEGAYFDWVQPTAEALLPLLSATDEVTLLCDEARGAAFQAWALLIKCARAGAKERGQSAQIAQELLRTFLQRTCAAMAQDTDPDTLRDAADGMAECLKNVGPGSLGGAELLQLVEQLFKFIDDSFERTKKAEQDKKQETAGAPAELQADEDDQDTTLDDEETCRRSLEEALGATMEVAPQDFMQCLPVCGQKIEQWLSTKQHKTLALFLACDLIQHLKENSESVWPTFMPAVFQALQDSDPDVRTPAAYAINLASPLAKFDEAAPSAFKFLGQIVGGPAPKKRDDKGKVALDNAVSALLVLAKEKPTLCPAEIPVWQLVVSKLPLKEDEEEAKKVHKLVCDLLLAEHAGLLGGGNHIGPILSALAEVYKQENICEPDTDEKILKIFNGLKANLGTWAASFSEKQQKKVEKMLS